MFARKIAILAVMFVALAGHESASAQTGTDRWPGRWYHGKYIGYIPPHLRAGPGEFLPSAVQQVESPRRSKVLTAWSEVDDEVVTASAELGDEIIEPPLLALAEEEMHRPVDVAETPYEEFDSSCCMEPCSSLNIWGRAESLLWWSRSLNLPPLATTSPIGTPQAQAGVLGQPGTTILYGNDGVHEDARIGGRFTLGLWLDPYQCRGIDVTYLFVQDDAESFLGSNNQFGILARPFQNVANNAQDARRIAFPGELQGSLAIQTTSEFQSFEALYRWTTSRTFCERAGVMLGYRYAELEERVRISESTLALAGPLAGTTFDLFDQFDTRNSFHGVEAGVELESRIGSCWSCNTVAKVALGDTTARGDVSGQTTTTIAGAAATARGGLLALPTNIGSFEESQFTALCEFDLTLRRQINRDWIATLGYSYLVWSEVTRAGEQIDLGVNTTQVPPGVLVGAPRPAFPFDMSSYWSQGLRFGLEYAY